MLVSNSFVANESFLVHDHTGTFQEETYGYHRLSYSHGYFIFRNTLEEPLSNNRSRKKNEPPGNTEYTVTRSRTYTTLTVITSTSSSHKLPLRGSCWKRNTHYIYSQRQYFIPSLDALSVVVSKINQNLSN